MICEFNRLIYPKDAEMVNEGSYMVALYSPCEMIMDMSGTEIKEIKAVGYGLPTGSNLKFDIKGHWGKSKNHGIQFEVEDYEEIIPQTKEGILSYLASGQIKGIGAVTAEKIFDAFGMDTLDILDNEPDRLLDIKGISKRKLERIVESYKKNRAARDVVAFLTPYGITAKRAVQFFNEYGNKAMEIVKHHPYQLCEIDGIGFRIADKIALSMGLSKLSPERVDEGILFTLKEAENGGNICIEQTKFIDECLKTLDTEGLTSSMIGVRATKMVYGKKLIVYNNCVYRKQMADAEFSIAENVVRLIKNNPECNIADIDLKITEEEKSMGITLAKEQKKAVKTALEKSICIITGGPGTGKTMIQKAILDIYSKAYPEKDIVCCAPTGKASRQMEHSTGRQAYTIHRVLRLYAGEDTKVSEEMTADFILVDEMSMVDIYVAKYLFKAVKDGARLILVGDVEQLPSVGPGAILRELINSLSIPVVYLDHVYRQEEGSRIAENARKIKLGLKQLEFGDDFQFVESDDLVMSSKLLRQIYAYEVSRSSIDDVVLLSPYRKKTETGVNALNDSIREWINPHKKGKTEIKCGNTLFREGDKIMQLKNAEDISNGDTGYIKHINKDENDSEIVIGFDNNKEKTYDLSDMEMIDLAYASTIHKSQGAEYRTVIINMQTAHYIMLNRSLLYTAVTRGKEKVIIVGEKKALYMAIGRKDTEKRGTNLAMRINELM